MDGPRSNYLYISKWLTSGSILDLLSQLFLPLAGWKVPRTSSRDEDFGCLTAEKSEARSPRSKMRLLSFRSMICDQHTFNYYIIIYFLHDFWSFLWSFTYLDYCRTKKNAKKISWYRDYPGSIDPQTVYPPFSSMLFPYIYIYAHDYIVRGFPRQPRQPRADDAGR